MPLTAPPGQVYPDIAHDAPDAITAVDHDRMDGFDREPGALTLGVDHAYTAMYPRDIPDYWAYARHFTLDDHFFSTNMASTFPNHLVTIAAQNGGVIGNPQRSRNRWGCDAPLLGSFDFTTTPRAPLLPQPHPCPIVPTVRITGAAQAAWAAREAT